MRLLVFGIISVILSVQSCGDDRPTPPPVNEAELREQLIDYNRNKMLVEDSLITSYLSEHALSYEKTPTGLRYAVNSSEVGDSLSKGDVVRVAMEIWLLDSTLCYARKEDDPFSFILGESDAPPGLHEMAGLLKKGDSAESIWPARLGYGLTGDQGRIPQDAILLVDLTMLP